MMDEVVELFKSWGLLNEIISTLIERGINSYFVLEKTEIEDVDLFFDKVDEKYFGERIKFKAGLREWRKQKNIPFICDQDTLSVNSRILNWLEKLSQDVSISKSRECTPCQSASSENSTSYNLVELLKKTVKGQLVLTYQEKNGCLDSRNQTSLTHCIVDNYIASGRKMQYSEMRRWANEISKVFPKETPEFYFMERKKGKKNPSGKLFSRWANTIKLENKTFPTTQESDVDDVDGDAFEKKCWLANNCTPWEKVKQFWLDTWCLRSKYKGSLSNLLADWPRYNDFQGYELVDIDFDRMHPGMGNRLFLKLDSFKKKILPVLATEVKDQASRELLLSKLGEKNLSNDSIYAVVLLLLHAVLQPQRLTKTHKPTIADAQSEFIMLVTTPNDVMPTIETNIQEYASRKQSLQPHIIAVGEDISNMSAFYVYCDGLKWKCSTLMKCVDVIIKLSYVFQIGYSHNSKQVWVFLEQYFFELKSEDFPSVSNLLSKLDK
ncbi:uncharacterized protein LOC142221346 isoform X2 [Haematobia irritans]|uniref:uncharacterized protein LOC142221346 isoform X2 n=1 Tax=Haematobia irritans TaxID=7368 RepID=UPI003F504117